jgi:hypothetical protein
MDKPNIIHLNDVNIVGTISKDILDKSIIHITTSSEVKKQLDDLISDEFERSIIISKDYKEHANSLNLTATSSEVRGTNLTPKKKKRKKK